MLWIYEGFDGVGKTTLAKARAEMVDAEYRHFDADMSQNTYEAFREIIFNSLYKNIVCDRFCWGQFVYQKEHERALTQTQLQILHRLLAYTRASVFLVEAPVHVINERISHRGEPPYDEDYVRVCMEKFRAEIAPVKSTLVIGEDVWHNS